MIVVVRPKEEAVEQERDIIALVGAGHGARSVLEALADVPDVEVRCVWDADPEAPGLALAAGRGIRTLNADLDEVAVEPGLDLVLETTGDPAVLAALQAACPPDVTVLGGAAARLVTQLSISQCSTAARLTDVIENATVDKACYLRQASHQVKSPLSSIQSYVNVILGGYTGEIPERTREVVEKIHARIDAALAALAKRRMLADLRCVDPERLETSAVHLDELAGEAVARQAELAGARGVQIRHAPVQGSDLVRGEPTMLTALLAELVQNAVVYSAEGGTVEVAVAAQPGGRVAATVRDHGIGVPERCLPKIFDEDYRADTAAKHNPDGAGLGLTVARTIADLHGFELAVQSDEGEGSTFTLTAPQAPAA
jgi:signal transduction histidine kinase